MLAAIPGNPVFLIAQKALMDWLIEARAPLADLIELHQRSYEHHVAIVNAIKARDPQRAEEALSEHLDNVFNTYYKN